MVAKKFGYVKIESNSSSSLYNDFRNVDKLRKELHGKPITEKSIVNAMQKVGFAKYDSEKLGIFDFWKEDGIAIVGKFYNGEYTPSVRLSWRTEYPDALFE